MEVKILERKRLLDDLFKVDDIRLQHKKFSGDWSETIRRLNFERGNSVGVLIYVRDEDVFILVRQFRFAVYDSGLSGWLDEIVAGMLDNESPLDCAYRECIEESGYVITDFEYICTVFVSPGASTEKMHLYIGYCNSEDKKFAGGGVIDEHEDIEIIKINRAELYQKLMRGELVDGKTMLTLQHFFLGNPELAK